MRKKLSLCYTGICGPEPEKMARPNKVVLVGLNDDRISRRCARMLTKPRDGIVKLFEISATRLLKFRIVS
jgi:hypothetical protein